MLWGVGGGGGAPPPPPFRMVRREHGPAGMWKTMLFVGSLLSLAQCAGVPAATPAATPAPSATDTTPRVARVWRGEVPVARAEEYDAYIRAAGLGKLRAIPRNLGVQMFRRTIGDREEFVVISYWPDEAAIRAYAGDDITRAHLLPRDPEFLIDPDPLVRHYRIVQDR
jgi:heme-degrading monooxygenase HmoA